MDALQALEQKVSFLVSKVKELKTNNDQLKVDLEKSEKEQQELRAENAKMAEENGQLLAKLEALEVESVKKHDKVEELNQERMLTKLAVDDLLERLKVIDSIVEEYQQ